MSKNKIKRYQLYGSRTAAEVGSMEIVHGMVYKSTIGVQIRYGCDWVGSDNFSRRVGGRKTRSKWKMVVVGQFRAEW